MLRRILGRIFKKGNSKKYRYKRSRRRNRIRTRKYCLIYGNTHKKIESKNKNNHEWEFFCKLED